MIGYKNDSIQINLSKTDYDELGNVSLDMIDGNLPIYKVFYGYGWLKLEDQRTCGGRCLDFIHKYIDITNHEIY